MNIPQAARAVQPGIPQYQAPFNPTTSAHVADLGSKALASIIGCVYMFFLFSHASEFIDSHGTMHLVLLVGMFSMIAVVASGTLPSVLTSKPGFWLNLFTAWIVFSLPFATWRGGSFSNFINVWFKSYIAFLLVAGLTFTLAQFRRALFWMALAGLTVMLISYKNSRVSQDDRLEVSYGTLGNANDLAGSLLMGLPFLLYVAADPKRNPIMRIGFGLSSLVLLGVAFKTGSRGGLLAIIALALVAFLKSSAKGKGAILLLTLAGAAVFPFVVSQTTLYRYMTMFKSDVETNMTENQASAVMSTNARRSEMSNAVTLTMRHPLFGVGIGNFTHQSANLYIERGEKPLWFTAHDIYLLVSSETGLPGTICYFACILVCLKTLLGLMAKARKDPSLTDVSSIAFCVLMSFLAFLITGIFSTSAYTFQLPLLAGLTAAIDRIARPLIAATEAARFEAFRQAIPYSPGRPNIRPDLRPNAAPSRRPALPALPAGR